MKGIKTILMNREKPQNRGSPSFLLLGNADSNLRQKINSTPQTP
jgi:hypothetical protein